MESTPPSLPGPVKKKKKIIPNTGYELGGGLAMGSNSLLINSNSELEFVGFLDKFRIGLSFQAHIYDTFPDGKKNKALHQNEAKTENMYPYSKDKKRKMVI